jgi:uncharacterized repeat protein (TIGR03803 family)
MLLTHFNRGALLLGTAALLAACGGSQPPINAAGATSVADASRLDRVPGVRYKSLHSFVGAPDGEYPEGDLTNVDGNLYGTTAYGGSNGLGTVFEITPSGAETVLYSFKGGSTDGAVPQSAVIDVDGTIYGTTSEGGARSVGAVYKITTSGGESLLYSFRGGSKDGSYPVAALTNANGVLYGTTSHGGGKGCEAQGSTTGCGTVFSITTSGSETVLYRFMGGTTDGEYPDAGLVDLNDTLYGTTPFGGSTVCSVGCGIVFGVTTSGKETVLQRFGGSGNGANPKDGLLNVSGTLYGTTQAGGSSGWGTVFTSTPSGSERVLYSFKGRQDGEEPVSDLIYHKGTLYGTTAGGGVTRKEHYGRGTIFAVTASGSEIVLYRFKDHYLDGSTPQAGLVDVNDTLYGTTRFGGTGDYGTVFALSLRK